MPAIAVRLVRPFDALARGPIGKRGGQPVYSAAAQAFLTIKILFGLPLRQTTGFVANLLKLAGLDWPVPEFSTLCRPLPGSACLHAQEGAEDLGCSAAPSG